MAHDSLTKYMLFAQVQGPSRVGKPMKLSSDVVLSEQVNISCYSHEVKGSPPGDL